MLAAQNFAYTPAIAVAVVSHEALSPAERMAIVINRAVERDGDEAVVTQEEFIAAEETCDIPVSELHGLIGYAKRIAQTKRDCEAAAYDRKARIEQGIFQVLKIFPDEQMIFDCLRHNGFATHELATLWPEIMAGAAKRAAAARQPEPAGKVA
ncbi:hypothetical protein [Devosia sp. DBB001]|nr:hypothetical protein [Devosia sp. DBB001]